MVGREAGARVGCNVLVANETQFPVARSGGPHPRADIQYCCRPVVVGRGGTNGLAERARWPEETGTPESNGTEAGASCGRKGGEYP